MVLHPPGREVHACARHGPYCFGGLRSFMSNPLLLKSGATTALVFHKPQNIKGTPCHNVMPLLWKMSMGLNPVFETAVLFGLHPCNISHGVAILGNIFAVRLSCKLPLLIWRLLIAVIDTPQFLWYFFRAITCRFNISSLDPVF